MMKVLVQRERLVSSRGDGRKFRESEIHPPVSHRCPARLRQRWTGKNGQSCGVGVFVCQRVHNSRNADCLMVVATFIFIIQFIVILQVGFFLPGNLQLMTFDSWLAYSA